MKKKLTILSLAAIILFLSGCWKSNNIVEYNDSFVAVVKDCTDSTQTLYNVFHADWSTIDSIWDALQESIGICQNSQTKASKLWDFDKDSTLKDAVIDLLSTEVQYLEKFWNTKRYRNIDNITSVDQEEYDAVVNDLYQSEEILNSKFNSLQTIQEGFAARHGLKLA